MRTSLNTPVALLVTDRPTQARIFERLGTGYCCGGAHSLTEACREKDLAPTHQRRDARRVGP
jgi:iron-sulfur cluster repair protein YtfE (RIC family)